MAVEPRRSADTNELPQDQTHGLTVPGASPDSGTGASRDTAERRHGIPAWGPRGLADTPLPGTEAGLEQSRRMADATIRVSTIYREAFDRSSEDMRAMMAAFGQFGSGMQQWQHAYFDMTQHWMKRCGEKRGELLRARNPVELAEAQRDLYLDAVSTMFTANTSLLQLAGRIVQDAVRPLQERARTTARG
jgi:Phasin protein